MTKHLLLIALLLLGCLALFGTNYAGRALMYSDSYMLRARGSEANYWNPALLRESVQNFWLPVGNMGFYIANNSLDLEIYNHIMKKGYLEEIDKEKLLNMIDDHIAVNMGGQMSIIGFTIGNIAFTSSAHAYAKAALDETYLRLLLYGNTEESYEFTRENNNASMLSYVDVTVGMGDLPLPLPKNFPTVKAGWAASLLVGIEDIDTSEYYGSFSSNYDGASLRQDIVLKTGGAGAGFKGMVGLVSEPLNSLSVGVTLDNILGFIKWGLVRENLVYHLQADSVYVANLQDDFYDYEHYREKTDSFTTNLPPELRLAALYRTPQVILSADYVQGFGSSIATSKVGRVSLGAELLPIPSLPIHVGYGFGNSNYPWRVSYGVGLKIRPFEFGIGLQSFESFLPGQTSKGIALSTYLHLEM